MSDTPHSAQIHVVVAAIYPQRFLDQNYFAQQLEESANGQIKISFMVSRSVWERYPDLLNSLEPKIIGKLHLQPAENTASLLHKFLNHLKCFMPDWLRGKLRVLKAFLERSFLGDPLWKKEEKKHYKILENKYRDFLNVFRTSRADILLIGGDRHITSGFEPAILRACKDLKIPAIIPYLTYLGEEEGLLLSSSRYPHHQPSFFLSNYIKKSQLKFSGQKKHERYFYKHSISNALDRLGVLSKNPWVMGSGESTLLCLPNKHLMRHYQAFGVSPSKTVLVGDVSYDKLYFQCKERNENRLSLEKKYGLERNKNLIVMALPQLAEHGLLSWPDHWEEIRFLVGSVVLMEQNVLLSMHPKMYRDNYVFLEEEYNCHIVDEQLSDVLPAGDLFVATFSSTVLWAVLCGIKSVVVDFYDLGYNMYDFLDSCVKVQNRTVLQSCISEQLDKNTNFSKDWDSLSRNEVFDGGVIDRYIDLIHSQNQKGDVLK